MEINFAILAFCISLLSLYISNTRKKQAEKTLKNNTLLSLFSGFDQANQAVVNNPNLLVTVHGLEEDDDNENIAYLAILIDAFHHYWGKEHDEKYNKVLDEKETFINRIIEVEDNYPRWIKLRSIFYGAYDNEFIEVMDELFKRGRKNMGPVEVFNEQGDLTKIIYHYDDGSTSEREIFISASMMTKKYFWIDKNIRF